MISVICPVYNELKYITHVLDFCIKAKPDNKEIIFIDGNSNDGTSDLLCKYIQKYPFVRLLKNENRYVAYALNMAIREARGDIIIRVDAHTEYADDYFEKILETFEQTGADIIGGPMRIAQGNLTQKAIGHATSTLFGVGNSSFHFEKFEGFTNSVYPGAWKKNIFTITGPFDESLKRNQDDEFHYRAVSKGLRIYQSPGIRLYYHPRKKFRMLFKQYFEYGLYKPLVLIKNRSALSIRHLAPPLFVLYLICLPFMLVKHFYTGLLPLTIYACMNIFYTLKSKSTFMQLMRITIAYFIIHISYGAGFIAGLFKIFSAESKGNPEVENAAVN